MINLKNEIREAARVAEQTCETNDFNAMDWLDLLLEDNPESFDCLFTSAWADLSENERSERAMAIRRAL